MFQYKDHLGNVRLTYAKNPTTQVLEIIEENNYYPFGLKHKGYNDYAANTNKYKYNGKELQDELGLNMYDMDMRQYDPAIGRWVVHDPIVHHSQSPYSAFDGNPIYWADPSGMSGEHYDEKTGTYINSKNETISFEDAMASYGLNPNGSKKSEESNNDESNESITESTSSSDIHPRGNDFKNRPRTTKVIEQLYGYVKNHPSILQTLSEYSGWSTMEVLQQLKYKQGNVILGVESLLWDSRHPDGITMSSKDIRLEIVDSNNLEKAKTNEQIQAWSFFVAVTVLHEVVHAGRLANNMDGGKEKIEKGWQWEYRAFGDTTSPSNMNKMYKEYDWNLKY